GHPRRRDGPGDFGRLRVPGWRHVSSLFLPPGERTAQEIRHPAPRREIALHYEAGKALSVTLRMCEGLIVLLGTTRNGLRVLEGPESFASSSLGPNWSCPPSDPRWGNVIRIQTGAVSFSCRG